MTLSDLLVDLEYSSSKGDLSVPITDITIDSRKAGPGSLFVALTGLGRDSHEFIKDAVAQGAAAVIAQREIQENIPYVVVPSSRIALARLSAAFYGNPASHLRIIGVTGTNGKTTVTHLIKQILELKGYKCGLIGTNHHMIGTEELPSSNTTPEPMDLHRLFASMLEEKVDFVIMEVSSHSLAMHRVDGIAFETGVFTNLTEDHLDFHKNMEEYKEAKARLFTMCRKGVLNADDGAYPYLKKNATCKMMSYGIDKKADLTACNIHYSERGIRFTLLESSGETEIRLNIPGRFSVYNALSAIGACETLGISSEDIQKGFIVAKGVKGRVEVLPLNTPYTVILDYAHTPDGIENVLNMINGFKKGRSIIVFGCGGDREKGKRPKMGAIASRLADICVVSSDNPRSEEPEAIIAEIMEGTKENGDKVKAICDRTEAIRYALSIAKQDDIILLAGKGHETYQVLKDKTIDFDERQVVARLLAEKKA